MDEPVYLRMAPEYRRCAWYAVIAGVLLAVVCSWVDQFLLNGAPAPAVPRVVVFFLVGMVAILPLRWSLRIDRQGIARRRLFGWGDLWSWDDFASGRIEKRFPYGFFDPARPWWRRTLSLGCLAPAGIDRAMQQINACYRLPDAPQLPDRLELKYAPRRRMVLDSKGIHLQGPGELREFLWTDVRRLHITRTDPLRRDFTKLELVLPDREIACRLVLVQYRHVLTWKGATMEVLNEFLLRYVSAERVEVDLVGERPVRRSDVERQLADVRKHAQVVRVIHLVGVCSLVGILVWMGFTGNPLAALAMGGMCAIPVGPLVLWTWHDIRSRCRKLEQQLASFDEPNGRAADRQDVSGDGETGGPSWQGESTT